jgi:hypothetical protein
VEAEFYALLEASVSTGVRCFWGAAGRDAGNPKVVVWRAGTTERRNVDTTAGPRSALLQVDVWGNNWVLAYTESEVIRLAIDGHRGGKLRGVFLQSIRDNAATPDIQDLETRIQLDFSVEFVD